MSMPKSLFQKGRPNLFEIENKKIPRGWNFRFLCKTKSIRLCFAFDASLHRHEAVSKTASNGFTLLELLIALTIFAIIGVAAYSGLDASLELRAQVEQNSHRLGEVQFAVQMLERDLEQAINRPVRDTFGTSRPAIVTSGGFSTLFALSRTGWDNPLDAPRSLLQRVEYRLRERDLLRIYWPVLDGAGDGEGEAWTSTLLGGVEELRVRWLDSTRQWRPNWSGENNENQLPLAAEITLRLSDWGEITRLIPLATGETGL